MSVSNSLSEQLEQINLSQENIFKISQAYLEAITSQKSNISVDITRLDGTIQTIVVPTNTFLNNELQRLTQSFRNVVGLTEDGKSRLIANDGTFREILISSFLTSNRPKRDELSVSTDINVKTNSIIENLVSPLTALNIKLSSNHTNASKCYITKVKTNDLSGLFDGISYGECIRVLSTRGQDFELLEYEQPLVSKKTRFHGSFDIENYSIQDGIFTVKTNTMRYSDENNIFDNTRILDFQDRLTNENGTLVFEVISTNEDALTFRCKIVGGVGTISNGEKLLFKETINEGSSVDVPVRLNEKSIIFISVVDKNTNISSAKSDGILFDSDNYRVNANGITTSFNEYFSSRVVDIGRYIDAMVRENSIPAQFGEKPTKPIVNNSDFQVVQINKHLTNTPNTDKLKKLENEKIATQNRIEILTTNINDLNIKISQGNYNTVAKLDADKTLRDEYINEKTKLSTLLGTIVTNMRTQLSDTAEQSITPKYRVRGFWNVQPPLVSDVTEPQVIVQYEVRYRYVSSNGNTSNSESFVYTQGDNQINATFSAWTNHKTTPLERYIDSDGIYRWRNNTPSDGDLQSINQLDIPISYGESVEFQIRAISEAGYPTAPLMSDWSDLQRVDFPQELLQESDVASMLRKNTSDELQVAVYKEFATQGVTKHIAKSYQEQERYFAHSGDEIASNKVTVEQKTISVNEYIKSLEDEINALKEKVDRRYATATIQIVDDNMLVHDINNNSTLNLFAGNYTDLVDLSNPINFGTIVEKEFKIKILNRNQQTIELLSLSSGVLNQSVPNAKYNNVPIHLVGTNTNETQRKGQILYLRNKNVDGNKDLYVGSETILNTSVTNTDINTNAYDSEKNIVNVIGDNVSLVKLTNNANLSNYITFTKDHPKFVEYQQTNDINLLLNELERLRYFNEVLGELDVQNEFNQNSIIKFDTNDKYLVGSNSCGSTLFLAPQNIESFQVDGIDTSSSKEIYSGDTDAILIPIKFQFRMTDAIGNPNGQTSLTLSSNFEYSKKIGVDLLINNKLFSFDISVSARFKPSASTNNIVNVIDSVGVVSQPNIS